ncbi:uncharacterized protein LOC113464834 [Ceratina calcarata]|uniref:Uncharacterized protein LOC113464834 n=1 Tax=Ceratina calcarata TaxID=156304 RepID=A0AAJ7S8M0_9HYME|nr:uncharacterized protein LOC113464834 [Ceratina calcarata]
MTLDKPLNRISGGAGKEKESVKTRRSSVDQNGQAAKGQPVSGNGTPRFSQITDTSTSSLLIPAQSNDLRHFIFALLFFFYCFLRYWLDGVETTRNENETSCLRVL